MKRKRQNEDPNSGDSKEEKKESTKEEPPEKKRRTEDFLSNDWVPISKTRNATLKDYCMDYFELYNIQDIEDTPSKKTGNSPRKLEESFVGYIMQKGKEFEDEMINIIKSRFTSDEFIKIGESYEAKSVDKYNKTLQEMKKGTPILYQPVVHNHKNKTYGCPDLIVRTDYLVKLLKSESLVTGESESGTEAKKYLDSLDKIIFQNETDLIQACKEGDYIYHIVDIKWSTLHFNSCKLTLRNNQNVKPFKTQLYLYNLALGNMQKLLPRYAYILGKGWIEERIIKKQKVVSKSKNPFERYGVLDFEESDVQYKDVAKDAVKWLNKLHSDESKNWTHNPPSNSYLYPNMSNSLDGKHKKVKRQIADKHFEITNLWQCGVSNRDSALEHGIKKWNDPSLNVDILGMRGEFKRNILSKILEVNSENYEYDLYPQVIEDNSGDWQSIEGLKIYLDFETISSLFLENRTLPNGVNRTLPNGENRTLPNEEKGENNEDENFNDGDVLFLIGYGYSMEGKEPDRKEVFNKRQLLLEDLSVESQKKLLQDFVKDIERIVKNYEKSNPDSQFEIPIFHWGSFEKTVFNKSIKKFDIDLKSLAGRLEFIDMNKIFKEEPIIVKGALNFSFKSVARAFYNLGLIDSIWDTNSKITNGEDAMYFAWKYYKSKELKEEENKLNDIMNQIKVYNLKDFELLYKVIVSLRNYTGEN